MTTGHVHRVRHRANKRKPEVAGDILYPLPRLKPLHAIDNATKSPGVLPTPPPPLPPPLPPHPPPRLPCTMSHRQKSATAYRLTDSCVRPQNISRNKAPLEDDEIVATLAHSRLFIVCLAGLFPSRTLQNAREKRRRRVASHGASRPLNPIDNPRPFEHFLLSLLLRQALDAIPSP